MCRVVRVYPSKLDLHRNPKPWIPNPSVCVPGCVCPSACVVLLYVCLFILFCVFLTIPLPTRLVPNMSQFPVHNSMGRTPVGTPSYSVSLLLWWFSQSTVLFAAQCRTTLWWVLTALCLTTLWWVSFSDTFLLCSGLLVSFMAWSPWDVSIWSRFLSWGDGLLPCLLFSSFFITSFDSFFHRI